eukprot:7988073-Karenia_brevis.AAC.1
MEEGIGGHFGIISVSKYDHGDNDDDGDDDDDDDDDEAAQCCHLPDSMWIKLSWINALGKIHLRAGGIKKHDREVTHHHVTSTIFWTIVLAIFSYFIIFLMC